MIRVFIGFDPSEEVSYHVLSQSIQKHSSVPVSIAPIRLSQLEGVFERKKDPLQSTEFSFSRFLVPYLCDYEGWAIFMDCDMLFLDDIASLWAQRDEKYALQVVKHNHIPKEDKKFLGQPQSKYARKNWSSVMLFNNQKCQSLTLDYIHTASGLALHQFKWLKDEQIGSIDTKWNYLVGYESDTQASNVHYTTGGPYFKDYEHCDYHQEWKNALCELLQAKNSAPYLQKSMLHILHSQLEQLPAEEKRSS